MFHDFGTSRPGAVLINLLGVGMRAVLGVQIQFLSWRYGLP